MRSKEELKNFFENGDIPKQEDFWEWQDSYWHKDEKLKNIIPLSGTEHGENITGEITSEAPTVFTADWGSIELESGARLTQDEGFVIEKKNKTAQLQSDFLRFTDNTPKGGGAHININPLQGIISNKLHPLTSPYQYIQKEHLSSNYYNKLEVESLVERLYKIKGSVKDLDSLNEVTNPEVGDVYNLISTGDNYVYVDNLNNTGTDGWDKLSGITSFTETDTLESVVTRGNYSSTPITFLPGSEAPNSLLGVKASTYGFHFGNMNPNHTGIYNIGIGYNTMTNTTSADYNVAAGHFALNLITTGSQNTAIGNYALQNLTSGSYNVGLGTSALLKLSTGNRNTAVGGYTLLESTTGSENTAIGLNALNKSTIANKNTAVGTHSLGHLTTGYKNTALGNSTGLGNLTSSLNTLIGYGAGANHNIGERNIVIGAAAGQQPLGNNNILIGVAAGNNDALNDTLIIHSNHSWTGASNTSEGIITNPALATVSQAILVGNFREKWLRTNGVFFIGNPASVGITANASTGITSTHNYNPTDDKDFVQKKYVDDITKITRGIIDSSSFSVSNGDMAGTINYEHTEGSDYVTMRLNILVTLNGAANDAVAVITLPFEAGIASQKVFAIQDAVVAQITSNNGVLYIRKTTDENISFNINQCLVFPYGFEAGVD